MTKTATRPSVQAVVLPWHKFRHNCKNRWRDKSQWPRPVQMCAYEARTSNYCRVSESNCPLRQNAALKGADEGGVH